MKFVMISDLVEENGKTIRENNMEKQHLRREGDEVRVCTCNGVHEGDCNDQCPTEIAFILLCGRDCDGTPLYWIGGQAQWNEMKRLGRERTIDNLPWRVLNRVDGGYPEDSLTDSDFINDLRRMLETP